MRISIDIADADLVRLAELIAHALGRPRPPFEPGPKEEPATTTARPKRGAPMTGAERAREYRKRQKARAPSREPVMIVTPGRDESDADRDASLPPMFPAGAPIRSVSASVSGKTEEEIQTNLPDSERVTRDAHPVTIVRDDVTEPNGSVGRVIHLSSILDPVAVRTAIDAHCNGLISSSIWDTAKDAFPALLEQLAHEGYTLADFETLGRCVVAGGLAKYQSRLVLHALVGHKGQGSGLRTVLGMARDWAKRQPRAIRSVKPILAMAPPMAEAAMSLRLDTREAAIAQARAVRTMKPGRVE